MEKDEFANTSHVDMVPTPAVTLAPTVYVDPNSTAVNIAVVEQEHETDAITVLLMNVTIIGCLLLAYYGLLNSSGHT